MKIIQNPNELQAALKLSGATGLVPTMGALHAGHLSLIQKAREQNKTVVVSVFVNPTQFLPGEDLSKYPRRFEDDAKLCEECGVDFLFAPAPSDMYGADEPMLRGNSQAFILEGKTRPGHFDGVLTVIFKLLAIVKPQKIYFGKKDAQQLILVRQALRAFFFDVQVVPCELVRDENGLALSSRNAYLTPEQKKDALALSRGLFAARALFESGTRAAEDLKRAVESALAGLEIDYVAVVDGDLNAIDTATPGNTIILVAAKVGSVRLIDNIWL